MSLTTTEAVWPLAVIVKVSGPSVRLSALIGIEIVAWPVEPTVVVPDREPEVRSAALTPVIE